MSETVEVNPINDMIQHALDQDFTKANDVFNNMMTVKMSDILDQEKIKLADQIYNGAEEEDEEQLELDLDDDEVSDESSDEENSEDDGSEDDDETEVDFEEEEE